MYFTPTRALLLSLFISLALMVIKFVSYFLTASDAILTDALESIINVTAGAFALFSAYLSSRPRDRSHPYGHGKIEFISAGVEGSMIAIAGISMAVKAVYSLMYPPQLANLDWGLGLTLLATVVNYVLGLWLVSLGKRHHSLILEADGRHIQSDAWSSAGLVLGLLALYLTQWTLLDSLLTLAFAIIILYTGTYLVREALSGVMDEADEGLLQEIIVLLQAARQPTWIDFHNLRVIKYGNALHIDAHVTLPWYWTLEQAHQEVKKIEELLDEKISRQVEVFLHTDPCLASSCRLCALDHCPHRQQAHEKTLSWTLENVLENSKHGLEDYPAPKNHD